MVQFPSLQRVGITFLASAGVTGVIVGLAARSTLANAFSAVTLCFSRPVKVGDTVSMGEEYGTIEDIGLMYTVFRTWDHRRLMIPNEIMTDREITNHSILDHKLWAKVSIYLDYTADLDVARRILLEVAAQSPYRLPEEEPKVWFMKMGEDSILLWVAAVAADPPTAWDLKCDIREKVLARFRQEGVPLPRRRYLRLAEEAKDASVAQPAQTTSVR
jgi:small-conductance mechanosensitive channel